MKVQGVILLTDAPGVDGIQYLPLDDTQAEFVPLDRCPAEVMRTISDISDANAATPIGVIVDLG